jgi:AcrR family transcriptional regulator
MDSITRKQRDWFEREQLILDTAKEILQQEGLGNLTMERVAAEIEYSKGTIYNHFKNKEEIISGISCRCMNNLIELFTRAKNYPGSSRERIAAISIAHDLYALLNPVEIQNMQIIKSPAVHAKICVEKRNQILALEQQVIGIVMDLVMQALSAGDIPADQEFVPDGIVLGLWTMGYGSNLLHLSSIDFNKLDMQQPLDMMWINSNKLLDSYHWKPLSTEFDINKMHAKISADLFHRELQQLKK